MGEPADRQLRSRDDISSGSGGWLIPDEILIDIISRLPVIDVLQWRCVSKKWKDVTTTLDFAIRLQRSNPTILVRHEDDVITNSIHLLDNWWLDPEPKKHRFANFPEYDYDIIPFSHDGLLVMKHKSDFVILNPLNRRHQVRIILRPETNRHIDVYGMFWHPNLKEYCIILIVHVPDILVKNNVRENTLHIVNLGSNPHCREVGNLWNHRIDRILDYNPVLVGNNICKEVILKDEDNYYWGKKSKSILQFDIMTEEFTLLSPPLEFVGLMYQSINLINIDGQLSCVRICVNKVDLIISISIWILRDHGSQTWICCNYNISCQVCSAMELNLRAIAFVDGKLVVSDGGLYICDLKMGTSKFFDRNNSGYLKLGSTKAIGVEMKTCYFPIRYVMSLASLANCKSEIRLDIGPSLKLMEYYRSIHT